MRIFSKRIENITKGNWVVFVSEENGWAKVRSQNGNIGYIKKKNLTNFITEREEFKQEEKTAQTIELEKDISKENISKYEDRKKVIEDILLQAVNKKNNVIKIIYNNDKESEEFKKFIIEASAIFKECGIALEI